MAASTAMDRLAMRARPQGTPVMEQNWNHLLFMHWRADPGLLRPLIPAGLELDLFNDEAWLSITPFTVTGLRLTSLPPLPGLSSFHEINLRTYVHHQGTPGIWFLSLDASKLVPAFAARLFFGAPHFPAEIQFLRDGKEFRFEMRRTLQPDTRLRVDWHTGERLRDPDRESLAFFLVERYCFFSIIGGQLSSTRVYHHPWILDEAMVDGFESTLIGAQGLPEPASEALAHFSNEINVQVWGPIQV